jgi:hypothetical protein
MRAFESRRVISFLLAMCMLGIAPPFAPESGRAGGMLWCKADPIVSVDGRLVDITLSIPLEYLSRVSGPTRIEIRTPPDVQRYVVLNDLGFNLQGSEVIFVDGGTISGDRIPIEIRASVPMALAPGETAPMEVLVWPDNTLPMTVVGTNLRTTVRLEIERRDLLTGAPLADMQ